MKEDGASDKPLDIAVLTRMKQFRAMNKLKKVALKVNNPLQSFCYINQGLEIKLLVKYLELWLYLNP
jgi:hypothetical protein